MLRLLRILGPLKSTSGGGGRWLAGGKEPRDGVLCSSKAVFLQGGSTIHAIREAPVKTHSA
jgi:hypothetical protein